MNKVILVLIAFQLYHSLRNLGLFFEMSLIAVFFIQFETSICNQWNISSFSSWR